MEATTKLGGYGVDRYRSRHRSRNDHREYILINTVSAAVAYD